MQSYLLAQHKIILWWIWTCSWRRGQFESTFLSLFKRNETNQFYSNVPHHCFVNKFSWSYWVLNITKLSLGLRRYNSPITLCTNLFVLNKRISSWQVCFWSLRNLYFIRNGWSYSNTFALADCTKKSDKIGRMNMLEYQLKLILTTYTLSGRVEKQR